MFSVVLLIQHGSYFTVFQHRELCKGGESIVTRPVVWLREDITVFFLFIGDFRSFDLSIIFRMKDGDLLLASELEVVCTCRPVGDCLLIDSDFFERDDNVEAMADGLPVVWIVVVLFSPLDGNAALFVKDGLVLVDVLFTFFDESECLGRLAGDWGDLMPTDLAPLNDDAMVGLVSRSVARIDDVRLGGTGASLSSR